MTAWDSEHTVFKMRGCEGSSAERGVDDGVTKSSSNGYQPEEVALVQEFSWYIEASDKFTKKYPSRKRFLRPHYYTIKVEGELAVPRSGRRSYRPTANFSRPRDFSHGLSSNIKALGTLYHRKAGKSRNPC